MAKKPTETGTEAMTTTASSGITISICEEGKHDIHTSSTEKEIVKSCRICPWTEIVPRS